MASLTMLGTGNAMCTRCYNTCFYLKTPGGSLMVDAGGGNGIFRQLHKAHIAYEDIKNMFVTHCHTDHILGVIWIIRKISPLMHKGRYIGNFTIYGEKEVIDCVQMMCDMMLPSKIARAIGDTIILKEVKDGETFQVDDMTLTSFDIESTKSPQFGFSAVLPDGQHFVCLGDEPYNARNEKYVKGCDWLLSEAFCLYQDREQFHPYDKNHSTAMDAGRLAETLGVKNLLLYHTEDTHLYTRKATYTAEAQAQFSGKVYVPDDLEVIEV